MGDMKGLMDKIASEMPDATEDEKLAALASIAMDQGFTDGLAKVASGLPAPVKVEEKTAAATKKIAGRTVDFEKMTFEDVVARLANRFGHSINQEQIDAEEKTAAAKKTATVKTGAQKFAEMLKAELARPT